MFAFLEPGYPAFSKVEATAHSVSFRCRTLHYVTRTWVSFILRVNFAPTTVAYTCSPYLQTGCHSGLPAVDYHAHAPHLPPRYHHALPHRSCCRTMGARAPTPRLPLHTCHRLPFYLLHRRCAFSPHYHRGTLYCYAAFHRCAPSHYGPATRCSGCRCASRALHTACADLGGWAQVGAGLRRSHCLSVGVRWSASCTGGMLTCLCSFLPATCHRAIPGLYLHAQGWGDHTTWVPGLRSAIWNHPRHRSALRATTTHLSHCCRFLPAAHGWVPPPAYRADHLTQVNSTLLQTCTRYT